MGSEAAHAGLTDQATLDAAIAWRIRLQYNAADAQAWQAFDAWLHAAPSHALVWDRLQTMGAILQQPASSLPTQAAARMLRQADAAHTRATRRKALMTLGILATGSGLVWKMRDAPLVQQLMADVTTPRGQQRRIVLPDGGSLMLNTNTRVNIAYTDQKREIELLAGEIYVISARDAWARPFFVQTRDGRAQALGTRYRVRQFEQYCEVAVDEGAVALWPRDDHSEQASVTVQAGQTAQMTSRDAHVLTASSTMDANAWTQGSLSVRAMPLVSFLEEVARYHGPIDCDPAVARLPVSGVFQIADTEQLLALLRQSQPIEIETVRHWWGGRRTHVRARS